MKTRYILFLLLLMPLFAGAQTKELDYTHVKPTFESGLRVDGNIEIDLIAKKLQLNIQEELRLNDNFCHFQRSYTTVGLDYRILPWLKVGADYSFILNNSTTKGWGIRHRGSVSLAQSVKLDRWKLSLRERFQATRRMDEVNLYQSPQTELSLKTRLKVAYDLPGSGFEPYISAEMRFLLNGVRPGYFVYNEAAGRWSNPTPKYSDAYINRLRLNLGTQYKASKRSEFDFYLVADLCYDLDIDFNSKGNQKKDTTSPTGYADYLFVKNSYFVGLGVSYKFKVR